MQNQDSNGVLGRIKGNVKNVLFYLFSEFLTPFLKKIDTYNIHVKKHNIGAFKEVLNWRTFTENIRRHHFQDDYSLHLWKWV